MRIDKDLVAASATPLVLAILAEGESYGYAILKRVRELSGGELEWTDGMLYPLLHRLEPARVRDDRVAARRRKDAAAGTTRSPTTGARRSRSSGGSGRPSPGRSVTSGEAPAGCRRHWVRR